MQRTRKIIIPAILLGAWRLHATDENPSDVVSLFDNIEIRDAQSAFME